ncbi:choice-of-anchor A domain-containing protein [Ruminococcus sp. YE71]|uniref:choice-of-anchor A family protein n=1 Tax=unclassified Ruminococcus TaxID=2608920 RepID=UPI00088E9C36|nr:MULTISPECIES: choice-of-anchor A family protein [unclassified Ruminococcus]SDA27801.1 choice-of-anchor A domain-containing protein [Ruminococcus sp. YE78]SFW46246.1 choice-of-anchor A domain-containing protein [Ruminococcus sp. YE71]
MRSHKKIAACVLSLALAANSVGLISYAANGGFSADLPKFAVAADEKMQDLGHFVYATEDTLGSANSYAVFSYDYYQNNHMEGVFAAQYYYPSGQGFGTTENVVDYINPGENFIYIENFGKNKLNNINDVDNINEGINNIEQSKKWGMILPDTITFDFSVNNGNGVQLINDLDGKKSGTFNSADRLANGLYHISMTTYQIDFDKAFDALYDYSESASQKNTAGAKTTITEDGDVLNIVCKKGANVITLDSEAIEKHEIRIVGEDGETDYSLIINVVNVKNNVLYNKKCTVDGKGGGYVAEGGKLLWNFHNATGKNITFQECNTGVILAPEANITVTASHNGSVFADSVTNEGCEIHQNPFTGSQFADINSSEEWNSDTSGVLSSVEESSSVEDSSSEEESSVEDSSCEEESSVEDSSSEEESSVEDSSSEEDSSVEDSSSEEDSSVEDSSSEEDSSVEDSSSEDDSSVEDSSSEDDSSVEDSSSDGDNSIDDSTTDSEDSSSEDDSSVEDSSSDGDNSLDDSTTDSEDSSSEDDSSDYSTDSTDSADSADSVDDSSSGGDIDTSDSDASSSTADNSSTSSTGTDSASSSTSSTNSNTSSTTSTSTSTTTGKSTSTATATTGGKTDSNPGTGAGAAVGATALVAAAMIVVSRKNRK